MRLPDGRRRYTTPCGIRAKYHQEDVPQFNSCEFWAYCDLALGNYEGTLKSVTFPLLFINEGHNHVTSANRTDQIL